MGGGNVNNYPAARRRLSDARVCESGYYSPTTMTADNSRTEALDIKQLGF
jgi:hypothetical protein